MLDKKPNRYLSQSVTPAPADYITGLYKVYGTTVAYGSESNSHYIDVVSLGPIGGIQEVYLDETPLSSGEFPKSTIFVHDGDGAKNPWNNTFPYVERTISLGKNADIKEVGSGNYSNTVFTRKVTSVGVIGLRINFTTAGFTHKDDKNRDKDASARFKIEVLNGAGSVVATETSQYTKFSAKNPTALQLYIPAPTGYETSIWEYRVTMEVMGFNHNTSVSGNWSASTATEVYRDTQTYNKIAYSSGTIVASDVSGKLPKRQYLTEGYKVLVPEYQDIGGNLVLTGDFTREVSDSPSWNAMAVITDTLWGAGQPLDKIDLVSFDEFNTYCNEIVDGEKRYSFSQYLIKADNYYKLASEMVGGADGRLYEDGSGRIGVLIDKQTSNRRVVTSYDIVDEMVKRTTVSEDKKINYVEAEFEDRDNQYKKTIIHVEDENAITKNGVISKNLKLDTCTRITEAYRTIKKMLVTSQVATSSYVLKVGHTHEDVQIGEVLEVYDRKYANVNYCGKTLAGSTQSVIQVDPRTPINLTGIKQPVFTIDNNRGVPTKIAIDSWTSYTITLVSPLPSTPLEFTSFGVDDADPTGTKPTLIRVLGVDDSSGVLTLEGVEYNDSLYSHVENGTPLVVHKYKYIPEQTTVDVTNLNLVRTLSGITASWASSGAGYGYGYNWKFTPVGGTPSYIGSGITDNLQVSLANPLGEGTYEIQVLATLNGESVGDYAIDTLYVGVDTGSTLPPPTGLSSLLDDGTFSTNFVGRSFTIRWDQVAEVSGVSVSHFKLRAIQGATTYEVIVDKSSRQYRFSEDVLTAQFGSYDRTFTIELITVDTELKTTELRQISISNPVPPLPVITINNTGSLTLSYGATLPTDLTGTLLRIWEGTSQFEPIPPTAITLQSSELLEVSLPDDVVKHDGTSYVFDAVWVDSFGSDGTNHGRAVFAFDPNAQIPVSPELTVAVPIDSQTVMVKYIHSGLYLKRIQASYRRYGTSAWTTLAEVFTVPPVDSDSGYDATTQDGYAMVSGLVRNIEYEFKLNVANATGLYSEDSNYIVGTPYLDVIAPDEIPNLEDIEAAFGDVDTALGDVDTALDEIYTILELSDPRMLIVEGVSDVFGEAGNTASIKKVQLALATETSARVTVVEELTAKVNGNTASIVTTQDALATEVLARITSVEQLGVTVSGNTAAISNTNQLLADETSARIAAINSLTATVNSNTVEITEAKQAIVDETSARVTAINNLTSVVNWNTAAISNTQDALANETSARVSDINSLNVRVGNTEAGIVNTNQAIVNETNARVLAISNLTATVNDNTAEIVEANQAIVNETNARVTAISSLTATVSNNTAEINNTKDALVTETNARVSDISSLNARVGNTEAGLVTTNQAIVDETNARVLAISNLTATVNSNTAGIVSANQAIVNETNARVTAIQQLTAEVGEDIALVDTSAKAAIGYCTIGGSFSSHETKTACEAAGGTWTNSTLATATRTVQVSSGGQTATVGSFYSSYVNLAGEVTGKAVMGVDVNGAFTGMEVVGGANYSQLTFKGDTIKFQNTSGINQLLFDNATNTWKFFGTVYAERLIGDVVELYGLELASVTFNNNVKRERLATFTIASAPFQRNLVINPLQFTLGGQSALKLELYIGNSIGGVFYQGQTIKNNHLVSSLYLDEVSVSSKPFYIDVTANTPLTLTLAITDIGIPSGYRGVGGTSSGKTSLTLARSGSSFSKSFP